MDLSWSVDMTLDRRKFLHLGAAGALGAAVPQGALAQSAPPDQAVPPPQGKADHTIRIASGLVELAKDHIVSTKLYNEQFPGPLLRLKEGQKVVVDIHNDTDTPEQLHWHGQMVPVDVDGSSEEGTPFLPPHGSRRITFTPRPSGFRFYHTHVRAGSNLFNGQYGGLVGPVYIEGREEPGRHDREVFLTLKEFDPWFSRGGDMASDLFSPSTEVAELKEPGEAAMKASLAKGTD